jgi:DNA-binding HxlR family transcriptional regulator
MRDVGALEKRSSDRASNAVETALTPAGEEMLVVSEVLEGWLEQCPKGSIPIYDGHVKVAVKALAEGWSSTLMHALASSPLTLTELSGLIQDVSYPALERRIGWMRSSGQLDALPKEARGVPYTPTKWLRQAITPLAMTMRCERRHMEDCPPITEVEVETAFLLALPIAPLPPARRGTCTLAVQTDVTEFDEGQPLAGVNIELQADGKTSSSVGLVTKPTTWVAGSAEDWLDAMLDGHFEALRIGGTNPQFAADVISAIRYALFIDR